jgi:radical SAM family uncharacterized protein/radical SAM-linked protein
MTSGTVASSAASLDFDPFFPGALPHPERSSRPFAPELCMLDPRRLTPLWQRVEKPGRYTGGEFGIPDKDPVAARARAVFSYPDTYELAMSNEGLKILYDRVQRRDDFYADRTALPWPDFGALLQQHGIPLYSLDRYLTVRSFDLWGLNVAHELHFTNLLYALDLAGIPLLRVERGPVDPLIIVGGTAVTNPLPLMAFVDGIFMGDGEEAIIEMMDIIASGKEQGLSRLEILQNLQAVEGLVIPDVWDVKIDENGVRYIGERVKKRIYRAPEFARLEHVVLPSLAITQDRAVIEVNRGCGQGCRFCHAGFWKRPVRNAEVDRLVEIAEHMVRRTGTDTLTLHSLSIADYPWLEELVIALAQKFGPEGISLSVPSLRVQVRTIPILEMTSGIRRSNITFALEAGSELMRERIHKKSSEENLHYLIHLVYEKGWDLVKVYFMLGLPDRDGREVEDLIRSLNALGELAQAHGPRKHANVTVSLFVPKPFTTFQWEEQKDPAFFEESIERIKAGMKTRRVHLKHPSPWMAWVEGLLSRSDHRIAPYILKAYQLGARFDSWDDGFRKDVWQSVYQSIPQELTDLWMKAKPGGSHVPWEDVVDGFPREKLVRDFEKFESINEENMNPAKKQEFKASDFPPELLQPVRIPPDRFRTVHYLSLVFQKKGTFVYISHLDMVEVVRKALRRIRLPMTFSQGFNKHEKLHLGGSLPIYFHSRNERIIVELYNDIDVKAMREALEKNLPSGLVLLDFELIDRLPDMKTKNAAYAIYCLSQELAGAIYDRLLAAPESIEFEKRDKKAKGRKMHRVSKRLSSALSDIRLESSDDEGWLSRVIFTLESPEEGAISITDLLSKYLSLSSERWNVDVKIEKIR